MPGMTASYGSHLHALAGVDKSSLSPSKSQRNMLFMEGNDLLSKLPIILLGRYLMTGTLDPRPSKDAIPSRHTYSLYHHSHPNPLRDMYLSEENQVPMDAPGADITSSKVIDWPRWPGKLFSPLGSWHPLPPQP